MGRTNPTYRNFLENFREKWRPFRNALRREDQEALENLFLKAEKQSHAASYMNSENPVLPALISIMLEQEKEIKELKQRAGEKS